MPLHKVRIETVDLATGEKVAALLGEAAASPALAIALFEAGPPAFVVEAYYDCAPSLATIEEALAGCGAGRGQPAMEFVADANWVALSQAALPPIRAGDFIVHGGHDRSRFAMRRLAVEIEAGEAFGTGHNATTALCLEALDGLARRRRFARVLDLGCGSGVLAIAAARSFPQAHVLASDNDDLAIGIARDNARLNRVGRRIRVVTALGFAHALLRSPRAFDLVAANILPGPLIELAPAMRRAIMHNGVAILSGLLAHQAREVAAAYRVHGFRMLQRKHRDGWAAIALLNTRS